VAYISADQRRKDIVKAAIDVIASEGLAKTTTRRIAERAGAPLGVLHYCFKDKSEVLQGILDEGTAMIRAAFDHVDPSEGLEATISNDIAALWQWYQDNLELQLALTEMGMARIRRGGPPKKLYAMWDSLGRDVMLQHLKEAEKHDKRKLRIPAQEIVRFILHRFDGLTLEYAASRDRAACQRQIDLLTEAMILLGLGTSARQKPMLATGTKGG